MSEADLSALVDQLNAGLPEDAIPISVEYLVENPDAITAELD
jgi:hypothetical protein